MDKEDLHACLLVVAMILLLAGLWSALWISQFAILLVLGVPRPEACAAAACAAEALCFLRWVYSADKDDQ
jgi:hypothetical protein